MEQDLKRIRLETEAIVVGYAMSRLDTKYLHAQACPTWRQAFADAGTALSIPPASLKNLRDEFDPLHSNARAGWHQRELRASRQKVLVELRDVSDDALLELVARIVKQDSEATAEAIDSLAVVTRTAYNVAERLLTGRRAEEHFLAHSTQIVQIARSDILDFRDAARGFDFGVQSAPDLAIEVKGIKEATGRILFTDREWMEAKCRGDRYWLVVVGNLAREPEARVVENPHRHLPVTCRYQTSVTAMWQSRVSL